MQNPTLLTRAEKSGSSAIPKWPFLLAIILFVGVLVGGNFLAERFVPNDGEITVRSTTEPLEVSLEISKAAEVAVAASSVYFDPTLMVLPNEQSYSRAYLIREPVNPSSPVDLSLHPAPYQFIRPYFRGGHVFRAVNQTPAPATPGWSRQEPSVLVRPDAAPAAEPPTFSSAGIYGDLQNRGILSMPEFPRLPGSDLLTPSEITIGVDASGAVKMVLLARPSGSDEADARALQLAREVSFQPSAQQGDRLAWGLLKVFWIVDLKPAKI